MLLNFIIIEHHHLSTCRAIPDRDHNCRDDPRPYNNLFHLMTFVHIAMSPS